MAVRVRVIEPPAPIVTLEEVKTFLRVSDDDADTVITSLIVAAQAEFDGPTGWLGRCFGLQKIEAITDPLCADLRLPYADVTSVISVERYSAGQWSAIPSGEYQIEGNVLSAIDGTPWPAMDRARIVYTAGMNAGDPRLQQLRTAIFFHVKIHFDDGDGSDRLRRLISNLVSTLRDYACP
ncbi:hypothetical protein BJF92_11295 [Rhizobium rhizosphaerae]|uniref:PhiE125 gp8 family phage protein n=1 Tax=Xaviernesmea rhizosphaerae TaxID=1672749 RepID=A0A1Q9AMW0_9HYPH|nr:head-tail connector protein [Xaviernesmea rhizosphaerae]OLP56666.1 hypothetical protein BJF92_11295 [Xaviernesmea rhizosphaerae]